MSVPPIPNIKRKPLTKQEDIYTARARWEAPKTDTLSFLIAASDASPEGPAMQSRSGRPRAEVPDDGGRLRTWVGTASHSSGNVITSLVLLQALPSSRPVQPGASLAQRQQQMPAAMDQRDLACRKHVPRRSRVEGRAADEGLARRCPGRQRRGPAAHLQFRTPASLDRPPKQLWSTLPLLPQTPTFITSHPFL